MSAGEKHQQNLLHKEKMEVNFESDQKDERLSIVPPD